MRKFNALFLGLLALSSTVFVSCKDKDDDDAVAVPVVTTNENSIPNGTTKFSLSVHVLSTSENNNAKVAGLTNATVTISQNGNRTSATTDESGIAVFGGLSEGLVSVFVKSTGFASTNETVTLVKSFNTSNGTNGSDADQVQFAKKDIALNKLGATLSGKIYGNFDFTGVTPTTSIPAGVKVVVKFPITIQPNVYTTTTNGSGEFTFTNLPEEIAIESLDVDYVTLNNTVTPSQNKVWSLGIAGDILHNSKTTDKGVISAF